MTMFKRAREVVVLFLIIVLSQSLTANNLRLTLEEAIELALDQNLTIKIADQEIERVDWLRKENWYNLLPSLSGSAQYTNNILKPVFFADFFPGGKMEVGSTHSYALNGTMQLPLLSFPLYKSIELSQIELESALESYRGSKIELLAQVKNSFYGVLMMEESLKVLEESYKNGQDNANNIREMYENGLVSEYDKIRSEVAVKNILPSITAAQNGVEMAKMQLLVLLSLDLNTPIELVGELSHYKEEILNGDSYYGGGRVSGNSSLKSLDLQLKMLEKSFDLVRSTRLPSLAAFANYQLQMQSEQFTLNSAWSNSVAVGLALQIPIFNKLSIGIRERETKIGIKQLKYQRELVESNLTLALKNSINEMERSKVELQSVIEAVEQAKKGYEISKVRYNTGAGTLLELNDTEIALTTAKLNLNQTIYSYIKAKTQYEQVIGVDNIEYKEN